MCTDWLGQLSLNIPRCQTVEQLLHDCGEPCKVVLEFVTMISDESRIVDVFGEQFNRIEVARLAKWFLGSLADDGSTDCNT